MAFDECSIQKNIVSFVSHLFLIHSLYAILLNPSSNYMLVSTTDQIVTTSAMKLIRLRLLPCRFAAITTTNASR